ncbi:calcium/sodium antiporter [Stappia sp. 28M-7]|uniref:calcium/sodium antiporter n=1 Tax=Stappia sp. 28M-7 TaxID=2762596 RepID=UPI00163BAE02|nr:calcium/sodium antiporter [Stappia sp. 28M-7]MBC2860403.1 calcium/sodium antiporter [Stappia sp. 28M-7]
MLLDIALVGLGLVLLFFGGDLLVRGAVALAARLSVPPLLIGLTIVGFGTSMPELLVSLNAALAGLPDIAVGNVVGSNTANILLILGLAVLVAPLPTRIPGLSRDLAVMLASAGLLAVLAMDGRIAGWQGLLLLTLLAAYLVYGAIRGRSQGAEEPDTGSSLKLWQMLGFLAAGLVALVFGADFLVDGATSLARGVGVSDAVIGLTIVAVGTSLPELATSVVAAMKRQPEIAVGNVVGSNIFNILGILGVTAAISPVPVAPQMVAFDIPVMLAVSLAIAALLTVVHRVPRWAGLALLAVYAWYCVVLFV